MSEKERIGLAVAKTLTVRGAFNLGRYGATSKRVMTVALGNGAAPGGVFVWQNNEPGSVIVNRVTVDVTTKSSGACTINVGSALSGSTSSANLLNSLDVGTATGTFDDVANPGALGKPLEKVPQGAYVTGSVASGSAAGLAGNAYVEYIVC